MNKRIMLPILAATLLSGGFFPIKTLAAGKPEPATKHSRVAQRLTGKLDLSADQRKQIKSALAAEKSALKQLLPSLRDARKDLREAIQASNANETTVRSASARVAAAEADLAVERMKIFGKISPILTEAQRRQLSSIQQQLDERPESFMTQTGSGLDD